jgi:hypothetical protein
MNQNSTLTYEHDSNSGIPVCMESIAELNSDCGGCLEVIDGDDGLRITVSGTNESDRQNTVASLELMGFKLA